MMNSPRLNAPADSSLLTEYMHSLQSLRTEYIHSLVEMPLLTQVCAQRTFISFRGQKAMCVLTHGGATFARCA